MAQDCVEVNLEKEGGTHGAGLRRDDGSQVWEVVTWWAHRAQAKVTAHTEISAQDSNMGFVRHRTNILTLTFL